MNAQVLGISVDHIPVLKAWAESLGGINYPLLSDFWPHGAVAKKYGVLRDEGYSERTIFIIDKNGVIQYIDVHDIDNQPSNETLFVEIQRIDPDAKLETPEEAVSELPHGGIVMYCSKWCHDCKKAREWLSERGLEYTEVDVWTTPGAMEQVRKWTNGKLITPTFDIDGKLVFDFEPEQLSALLD